MTLARKDWHKDVTDEAITEAVSSRRSTLDDPGFCLLCGLQVHGVEPDARNYKCESCGAEQVFGAEELLLEIMP